MPPGCWGSDVGMTVDLEAAAAERDWLRGALLGEARDRPAPTARGRAPPRGPRHRPGAGGRRPRPPGGGGRPHADRERDLAVLLGSRRRAPRAHCGEPRFALRHPAALMAVTGLANLALK